MTTIAAVSSPSLASSIEASATNPSAHYATPWARSTSSQRVIAAVHSPLFGIAAGLGFSLTTWAVVSWTVRTALWP